MTTGETLELIPRGVRDKLDRVGIRLHLAEWQALGLAEREWLCTAACTTTEEADAYAARLEALVRAVTGKPPTRLPTRS
jgi:hypothetical protein